MISIYENNINNELFASADLCLCSYLNLFFPILKIKKVENNKVEFIFQNTNELKEAISNFYNNSASINPITYFNSIKSLKSRIYMEM